jgi:class 3 adenylate cyclase
VYIPGNGESGNQAAGAVMETKKVALVIADISGYTQFIRSEKMSAVHAEEIIFELLEAVIDHAAYPLTLNKLEGDAALLYAELKDDEAAVARDAARQAHAFFDVFYERARLLSTERADCDCNACQRILDLRLKAFLHHGEVVFKKIRQFEEMAGEDIIIAHRLIKNSIPSNEYILMTDAFHQLAGDLPNMNMETRHEIYEDIGAVTIKVFHPKKKNEIKPDQPIYAQFF